jgi:probable HAF family extracellular repeat protein
MTDLGALPGADEGPYPYTFGNAINNVGQIVGVSYPENNVDGFLWQNGTMTDLGVGTEASAINDAGQIVGRTNTDQGGRAVLWQNGTMTDLGAVGGGMDQSAASGINRAGQIMGNSYTTGSGSSSNPAIYHATLWTVTTHNTPVGSYVPVSPVLGVTMKFPAVTSPGNTTATSVATPPPSGFTFDGVAWDISTTATYTPPVTICLPYNPATKTNPHLYHYTGGAWVDITTGFDPVTLVVCGTATSFSPFAVLVPSAVPFASFTARAEIRRSHAITKHGGDSFEIEGRGVLNAASNGIAPSVENVTVKQGALSLAIPAGSFVKKADKDDDHGKKDDEHGKRDRDHRITTYNFRGVIAGVLLSAEIEQGPKHTFRFHFEGQHANLGVVRNPVTVGLAIGDDVGLVVVKADIDK